MIVKNRITKELLGKFYRRLAEEEKSGVTIAQYMRDVQDFRDFFPNEKSFGKEQVIAYKEHLAASYRSVATINTKLAALNKFFSVMGMGACRVKLLRHQRRLFCDKSRELTRQEYLRLLAAAQRKNNTRLLLIMQTICATGIRVSELKYVTCQSVKANRVEVTAKSKTRRIFLPPKLRQSLLAYMKKEKLSSGAVFVTKTGRPMDRSNIWSEMKALCASAGVEASKVFPHNLRHLFAKEFYAVEKDIFRLADILGHSSVDTTRIYTITSGYEHERKINALGLVL